MWLGAILISVSAFLLFRALRRMEVVDCTVEEIYEKELRK